MSFSAEVSLTPKTVLISDSSLLSTGCGDSCPHLTLLCLVKLPSRGRGLRAEVLRVLSVHKVLLGS